MKIKDKELDAHLNLHKKVNFMNQIYQQRKNYLKKLQRDQKKLINIKINLSINSSRDLREVQIMKQLP